ncbi:MAG: sodium:solute symporter [Saprospiraceae bacterium]
MLEQLTPTLILGIVAAYFLLLVTISYFTSKDSGNANFFLAGRQSPWYLVAFGMIGASLSGVTFISVPGWVAESQFSYMQMVLGYLLGYLVIATVLMPMYYRLQLTSIYSYLDTRFGDFSYKTGASFFLLSRAIGASFRLYIVALVLQEFVMNSFQVPFWLTVLMTIVLIWIYTYRGGIKTIVWTDTLQTLCMLTAVIFTIIAISQKLDLSVSDLWVTVDESVYSQIFFFEGGWGDAKNFFKLFLAGASMAIVMTGLDQDMMQKNLSCKTLGDAQKNMFWFSIVLVFANLLFLTLGALLFIYAGETGIEIPAQTDLLFPTIAIEHLSPAIGIVFILGLIAAAYSSADSALTALTTSFCVDFLGFKEKEDPEVADKQKRTRFIVHLGFSLLLFVIIFAFWLVNDRAVIDQIFTVAGYTYGPLLGLYSFGFLMKHKVLDQYVPWVCILSPMLTFLLSYYSETLFFGYKFGFELLILNGLITFLGLFSISYFDQTDQGKDLEEV